MLSDFPQGFRGDELVWELLEELLSTLTYVTAASEDERQWSNGLWHGTQSYLVTGVANRLTCHCRVSVVVGWSYVLKKVCKFYLQKFCAFFYLLSC